MVIIRKALLRDLPKIVRTLRPEDRAELRLNHVTALSALRKGFCQGAHIYLAVTKTDHPIALFGTAPQGDGIGTIWMVATTALPRYQKALQNLTQEWLLRLAEEGGYHTLSNLLDSRNDTHLRWVERQGFSVVPLKLQGHLYYHISWCVRKRQGVSYV